MTDSGISTLWSDQDFTLYLFQQDSGGCRFEFTKTHNEQGPTTIIAAWVRKELKSIENISVFATDNNDQGILLDIIWNSDHFVYRDTVNSNEGFQSSAVVLQVEFTISIVCVLWSLGLLLVGEEILDNLHIFNTTTLRRLGYITLQHNSMDSLYFDVHTTTLWCLVRKYDNLTRSRTTHLNCYSLPEFKLFSRFPMPRGFELYRFLWTEGNQDTKEVSLSAFTTTILCVNELVPKYLLLHFSGPKRPYYKQEFRDFNSLFRKNMATNTKGIAGTNQ